MRPTRREIFSHSSMLLAYSQAGSPASAQSNQEPRSVEAKTVYGRVRGVQGEGLVTFKGIPYAGSVAGANRFKAAPELKPWIGIRDALTLGAPAIQPGQRRNEPAQAEDCLRIDSTFLGRF